MIKVICNKLLRFLFDYSASIIGPKPKYLESTKDIYIADGLKLRIYKPHLKSHNNPYPTLIYFHGGGWTIGSLKSYDRVLRYLSFQIGCMVIGVEYRKAPEYKFPTAASDALQAYHWVVDNVTKLGGDINKIMIGGDSVGGNLVCVVLNNVLKTNQTRPIKQALIYPVIDVSEEGLKKVKNNKRWWIGKIGYKILCYQLNQYINSLEDTKSELICPDFTKLNLGDIKSLIITAEFDPLTVAAEEYITILKRKNSLVVHKHYSKAMHGFIQFAGVSKEAKSALDEVIMFLKEG